MSVKRNVTVPRGRSVMVISCPHHTGAHCSLGAADTDRVRCRSLRGDLRSPGVVDGDGQANTTGTDVQTRVLLAGYHAR
jgi:hypothetical protein